MTEIEATLRQVQDEKASPTNNIPSCGSGFPAEIKISRAFKIRKTAMSQETDFSKIKVGKSSVGIVGLNSAIEQTVQKGFSSDDEVADHLLQVLKRKNYIPPKSEPDHALAFLREFKKFRGEPFEMEEPQGLEVKILGPGCPNCDKLEQMVFRVMGDSSIAGDVEHVRDLAEIADYGLVPTPALVINGKIKSSGRLPQERQILQWLKEAAVN
jgi:small redox-active disulfide protein 2